MKITIEIKPCKRDTARFLAKFPVMTEGEQRNWLLAEMLMESCCAVQWKVVR